MNVMTLMKAYEYARGEEGGALTRGAIRLGNMKRE